MNDTTDDTTALTRRNALKGLAGLATATGLAGCTVGALPTRELPGNYRDHLLRYGQVLPPISLDPVEAEDPWSMQAARRVFQSLYVFDREANLVPVLADGPPETSEDGTRYAVSLREGPRFHDGSALSPADVAYSFEAPMDEATPNRWKVNMIEEIAVLDDTTVEFRLSYPYPNFDHSLTQPVVSKAARQGNAEAFGHEFAVGTGPYRLHTFKPGAYALLDRWEDYWGQPPNVGWLKFASVHSGLARTMSLKTGQNDIVERIQPKFWSATEGFPNADVVKVPSYTGYYLGFNTSGAPLSNPRVREAVDYLVSIDEFVEEVVGEDGRRQYGPVPNRVAERWGFPIEEWRSIPHRKNTRRAASIVRTELKAMGLAGWAPTVVAPHNDYLARKLAAKVAHALKGIGYRRARSKTHHWHEFQETITSGNQGDYAMFVTSRAGGPDPDSFLYPMLHENMQGITAGTYYNRESVMRGLLDARRTTDRAERESHYEDAISTLLEDRAVIPAFTLYNSFGVKRHVGGFEPHPMAAYNPMTLTPDGEPSLVRNTRD